jgi:hypothetical protein
LRRVELDHLPEAKLQRVERVQQPLTLGDELLELVANEVPVVLGRPDVRGDLFARVARSLSRRCR